MYKKLLDFLNIIYPLKIMDKEIWKDIPNYEGLYQVSNLGRIKSLPRQWIAGKGFKMSHGEKIISPSKKKGGYLFTHLYKNKKEKIYLVHRLVAIAFIPNPENKPGVNHKDGIKGNANLENLEWVTKSENEIHAHKMGLKNIPKGENHYNSKLSESDVKMIREMYKNIDYWKTKTNISKLFHISSKTVEDIIKYKTWKSATI